MSLQYEPASELVPPRANEPRGALAGQRLPIIRTVNRPLQVENSRELDRGSAKVMGGEGANTCLWPILYENGFKLKPFWQ